jgi:hypothetical protein
LYCSAFSCLGRKVSPDVRWGLLGDRAVILNLRTNAYLGLDPLATLMWKAVAEQAEPGAAVQSIASAFHAPLEQVARDYEELLGSLTAQGLLIDGLAAPRNTRQASEASMPRTAVFPSLRAWRTMLAIRLRLRAGGLTSAYAYAESCPAGIPARDEPELPSALAAFRSAENFWLDRRASDDCLSRSLSLFVFLRRAGFSVRHKIGVADTPFRAHAWVESQGQPLFEEPDRMHRFTVLSSLP